MSAPEDMLALLAEFDKEMRKQKGPARFMEESRTCVSPGCGSPTYLRIQLKPLCLMHAVQEMNRMLVQAGVKE